MPPPVGTSIRIICPCDTLLHNRICQIASPANYPFQNVRITEESDSESKIVQFPVEHNGKYYWVCKEYCVMLKDRATLLTTHQNDVLPDVPPMSHLMSHTTLDQVIEED